MTERNLSPQQMFIDWAREHTPLYAFNGSSQKDFADWKAEAYPKVLATLGDFPEKVELNPELQAEWHQDGIIKQRWIIDVGEAISATLNVCMPENLKQGEKRPAILCWHGHGGDGKEPVFGNDSTPELKASISQHNYDYGFQMAKKGFVTFGIDWFGQGDRSDANKPHHLSTAGGCDWCNLYYLHATMYGMTPLSIYLSHGAAATDFVSSLPFVDKDRLGVMGLSGGGTMTLWTAFWDKRIKAAEIICYSDLWAAFDILDYCGMQVAPGLYKLVELPDLQGLLAPMPLLIDIGAYDTCFRIDTSMKCYKKLESIYKAAAASDKLELDFFPGGHAWGGNKSEASFRKHLRLPE